MRLKDEAEAEGPAEASVRREADLAEQRAQAAVRVREPPRVGSRVRVYWEGDLKWEEGEVVAEIPAAQCRESVPRLQHRVRYHVHLLYPYPNLDPHSPNPQPQPQPQPKPKPKP